MYRLLISNLYLVNNQQISKNRNLKEIVLNARKQKISTTIVVDGYACLCSSDVYWKYSTS